MRKVTRAGFTVLEILIAIALLSVIVTIVVQLQGGAGRMSKKTGDVTESMRSVLLATEFLRLDLGRTMVLDEETRITVEDDGRKLNLSISDRPDADLSKLPTVRITYSVEPLPGAPHVLRLLRRGPGAFNEIKDCYLHEFKATYVPLGEISSYQAYVEIVMVGVAAPRIPEGGAPAPTPTPAGAAPALPPDAFVASMLLPVSIPKNPYPYELMGGLDAL